MTSLAFARAFPLLLLAAAAPVPNGSPNRTSEPPRADQAFAPAPVADVPTGATAEPTQSAQGFQPAPMPDPDLYLPAQPAQTGTQVMPGLYHPNTQFRGDGFSPGSSSQVYEERNFRPGPVMNITVPLQ